ncbi:MAG: CoA transferase subunit A [Bacteroidaceae bacterium]|jgi:acetate CoA/acetoacetate CoA-transferase alpha subunit|nr:CoA transferase subunit A [Bacteroidaceae bacterium]MBR5002341.1 CoA transferase subunit A [Bacteroidaceae bacterium]
MKKQVTLEEAVAQIKDGMTIMVGGFLAVGAPTQIVDALVEKGVKDLTLICNDTAFPDQSIGKLIVNRQVKKLYVSHIGTNPETSNQMNAGELDVEFCPQGTLAERIRAKGAGLGGVLTATGLGTIIAEGKEVITVDGKEYLLEKPLGADVAIIGASIADEAGNLIYKGTTQNFNPLMATAADIVIAEAEEVVATGTLAPETIHTSGVYVDYLYKKQ